MEASQNEFVLMIAIPRLVSKLSPVQKLAMLYCKPAVEFTKTGLHIGPAVLVLDSDESLITAVQNTPISGFQISTDFEATYVHVLFASQTKTFTCFTRLLPHKYTERLKCLKINRTCF